MKIAKPSEMKEIDRKAIEEYKIPGIILMENAGKEVARIIEKEIFQNISGKKIYIYCGKGNNGGDGFVVARHLFNKTTNIKVFIIGQRNEMRTDTLANLDIIESMRLDIKWISQVSDLQNVEKPDLIIDALLGTGTKGKPEGLIADVIEFINKSKVSVLAIDIPSGLDGETGRFEGSVVHSDWTVTMGLPKVGLLFSPGREITGRLFIADISLPSEVIEKSGVKLQTIEINDAKLPHRPPDAYKSKVGKVLLIAGSIGMTGAAILASLAVMRTGAGLAMLGIPKSLNPILEIRLPEIITIPLEETANTTLSLKAEEKISEYLEDWANVLAIGPGLSRNGETQHLIRKIVQDLKKPCVIDADAINALSGIDEPFKSMPLSNEGYRECIITPHIGEFSRLTGYSISAIESDRIGVAQEKSAEYGIVLVLKGAPTIVAVPSGEVFVNSTGNPGMATGGAGDVLTGIIASLMAQGLNAKQSAITGVYLHGLAGDIASKVKGQLGLIASDLIEFLPEAMKNLENYEV